MKYNAQIKVYGDVDKISKVFEPEINKKDRAEFNIKSQKSKISGNLKISEKFSSKHKEYVLFEISAKDSVALRATLNSITKLFTVYEKIEEL